MTKISQSPVEAGAEAHAEALSSGLPPHTVHHEGRPAGPASVPVPGAIPVPGAVPGIEGVQEVCDVKHSHPDVVTSVRPELVSLRAAEALAATFSVLGDPTRVRLLDALAAQELCVCELAELVGISESAVSHQLRLLRSLRLVRSRRNGRMVFYRLDDNHIRLLLEQGRRHIEEDADLDLVDD
jgi:DNA-binding transcriptional ArsR family regulator